MPVIKSDINENTPLEQVNDTFLKERKIFLFITFSVDTIGSEGAEAPVCPQNRAYGSVHGSSCYTLIHR